MWGNVATALIGALITIVVTTFVVAVIFNWIRESVAQWLRINDLQESALMDAWIKLDKVVGKVRTKLFVKTYQTGTQQIKEEQFSLEQLKKEDADVYAELQRRGYAEKNIMSHIT